MKNKLSLPFALICLICLHACSASKKTTAIQVPQNDAPKAVIVLNNGQKITVTTTSNTDSDMGMGMQMKNISTATNLLQVIATNDTSYAISNTLTKMSISMDMMGQQTNYDSEKDADKDSDIGKSIATKLNHADTLSVNKMTGLTDIKSTIASPEKEEKNPMVDMMAAMGVSAGKDPSLEAAFFIIPKDKKTGDSWSDSTTEKNIRTLRQYTLQSINNDIATIVVKGSISGNGEAEVQGTTIAFTMNTKNTGEIIVNVKNSLVNKMSNNADVSMTMDMMGQSMPISSKTTQTIVFQY